MGFGAGLGHVWPVVPDASVAGGFREQGGDHGQRRRGAEGRRDWGPLRHGGTRGLCVWCRGFSWLAAGLRGGTEVTPWPVLVPGASLRLSPKRLVACPQLRQHHLHGRGCVCPGHQLSTRTLHARAEDRPHPGVGPTPRGLAAGNACVGCTPTLCWVHPLSLDFKLISPFGSG